MENQPNQQDTQQSAEKTVYSKIIQLRVSKQYLEPLQIPETQGLTNQIQNIQPLIPPPQQSLQEIRQTQSLQNSQIPRQDNINQQNLDEILEDKKSMSPQKNNSILGGCLCAKSHCLKMYCSCFRTQTYCSKKCKCRSCVNTKKNIQNVKFARDVTKKIQKYSFQKEVVNVEGYRVNRFGCNCTSQCKNLYCYCKKIGVSCSSLCRCPNCKNQKINFEDSNLKIPSKGNCRKKHKIKVEVDKKNKKNPYSVKFQHFTKKNKDKSSQQSNLMKILFFQNQQFEQQLDLQIINSFITINEYKNTEGLNKLKFFSQNKKKSQRIIFTSINFNEIK